MRKDRNIYIACEDCILNDNGTYLELTWEVQVSWTKPDLSIYRKLFSFTRGRGHCTVYVHGGVERTPSRFFIEGYLRRSRQPLIVKFRENAL